MCSKTCVVFCSNWLLQHELTRPEGAFHTRRYDVIVKKLGGDGEAARAMGKLLSSVAGGLSTEAALKEVDSLMVTHRDFMSETRYAEEAKESIRANIQWHKYAGADLCNWLAAQ